MARKALIAKNEHRKKIVEVNFEIRAELRKKAKQGDKEAQIKLNKMSRDSSYIRIRNRDQIDGRPRGYIGRFGISRIKLRDLAHDGQIPGIKKASW